MQIEQMFYALVNGNRRFLKTGVCFYMVGMLTY